MPRRRYRRAQAGQIILASTHDLMDRLLVEEHACFDRIEDEAAALAETISRQLSRIRTGAGFVRGARTIVASVPDLKPAFRPAVGDLIATARERTLRVVVRHLEVCAATLPIDASDVVAAGRLEAEGVVIELERYWLGRYEDAIDATTAKLRSDLAQQLRVWQASAEEPPLLVRRWCSAVPVSLPGSQARGSVFMLRAPLAAAARGASMAVVNGVLLAGYHGWNARAAATA